MKKKLCTKKFLPKGKEKERDRENKNREKKGDNDERAKNRRNAITAAYFSTRSLSGY